MSRRVYEVRGRQGLEGAFLNVFSALAYAYHLASEFGETFAVRDEGGRTVWTVRP